MRTAGRKCMQ